MDEAAGGDATRHVVYALCREAQHIYASEREAALQAAQWARLLAARLQRAPPPAYAAQRGAVFRSLLRLRDSVVAHTREIVCRSAAVQALPPDAADADAAAARVRELLLQAHKLGFEVPPTPDPLRTLAAPHVPSPYTRTCTLFAAPQRALQICPSALPAAGGEVLQETARVPPADQAEGDRDEKKETRDHDH